MPSSGVAIAILAIVIAILLIMALVASRYQKVSPNEVLVIAGRKRVTQDSAGNTVVMGHRIVKGGGTFVYPVLEKVNRLSLNAMAIDVTTADVYTKNGVPVTVDSVIVMKIGGDDLSISAAAERFLGFKPEEIKHVAQEVLGGHLRSICSTMTPEDINADRTTFQQRVLEVAHKDFQSMGLIIDAFTVRQISDKQGYMDALGRKSAAEVKRNAQIGEAEALDRDATQSQSLARQAGQVTKAETEAAIAEANRNRDVKMQEHNATVEIARAKAGQAGPRAEAEAKQDVIAAQTDLAKREAIRKEAELIATVIKTAEAERQRTIINAEAARQSQIVQAEGEKASRVLKAEADQKEREQEGLGEAAKIRNVGMADGEASKAKGLGEAEAIRAKLLAEAEGLHKKAEAMKAFNDAGMNLQIATSLIAVLPEIVKAATSPLASVKDIRIMDFGGGNTDGHGGPVDKLLNITPQSLMVANEALKNTIGMDLTEMIKLIRTGKSDEVIKMAEGKMETK
ncbi:MAG: SPFH domain-containing protein [Dehalogenimonas sp.]